MLITSTSGSSTFIILGENSDSQDSASFEDRASEEAIVQYNDTALQPPLETTIQEVARKQSGCRCSNPANLKQSRRKLVR